MIKKIDRETILELIQDIISPIEDKYGREIEYNVDEDKIKEWISLLNNNISKIQIVFEDENKKEQVLELKVTE